MPLPKAAAQGLSYGIKIGGATSFMLPDGEKQKEIHKQNSIKSSIWNPSLGLALYMGYDFNDHIGLATELLYSRFTGSTIMSCQTADSDASHSRPDDSDTPDGASKELKITDTTSFYTIGLPVLLVWNWTAAIRPDFKEAYFLGRIFIGFHPFWCMMGVINRTDAANENEVKTSDIPFGNNAYDNAPANPCNNNSTNRYNKDNPRFKTGLIGGVSFEFPSGLLLEIKCMAPYNLTNMKNEYKDWRPNVKSFHLSVGYNFGKIFI